MKNDKELSELLKVIQTEADIVKKDYEDNPSNLDSGSVVVVHENSTLLDNKDEETMESFFRPCWLQSINRTILRLRF